MSKIGTALIVILLTVASCTVGRLVLSGLEPAENHPDFTTGQIVKVNPGWGGIPRPLYVKPWVFDLDLVLTIGGLPLALAGMAAAGFFSNRRPRQ